MVCSYFKYQSVQICYILLSSNLSSRRIRGEDHQFLKLVEWDSNYVCIIIRKSRNSRDNYYYKGFECAQNNENDSKLGL